MGQEAGACTPGGEDDGQSVLPLNVSTCVGCSRLAAGRIFLFLEKLVKAFFCKALLLATNALSLCTRESLFLLQI